MAKLILRQEAINDLTHIWNYIANNWSENQADNYYQMIKTACIEIGNNPIVGKSFDKINSKLFGYRIGKHIIFYQSISNEEIEIIRILHERMDLKRRIIE